jgi:transposase-like protein
MDKPPALAGELLIYKNTRDMSEFSGEIEIDESYFGGARKGQRGRGAANKTRHLPI